MYSIFRYLTISPLPRKKQEKGDVTNTVLRYSTKRMPSYEAHVLVLKYYEASVLNISCL